MAIDVSELRSCTEVVMTAVQGIALYGEAIAGEEAGLYNSNVLVGLTGGEGLG